MKILQWSMTIPKMNQRAFLKCSREEISSTWKKFGCIKYELLKVENKPLVGKTVLEQDRFIERLYFGDSFNIPSFFEKIRKSPKAWKLSRKYEGKFGAHGIELRILISPFSSEAREKIAREKNNGSAAGGGAARQLRAPRSGAS
ncbi:hypothetical protein COS12_01970 [Candidatus Roizmanbacteria bacterium CG01_land_8_20_14_3_00_33_9]|uniref:Uncharacterized protein n=1 Tax=Candidatus Roizmanbacteria bacterium CG01_land_8_20_14_3_00_33_9 TaxID=1974843 RepID=A0A2M7E474_9BACT|nr:MAG: hypothetical protein COS12_01970 [Candidatus Roizmanbacteria bacterium CG01_land_8_20_14_3_00_33_9]